MNELLEMWPALLFFAMLPVIPFIVAEFKERP
jgi:hypothetical protein